MIFEISVAVAADVVAIRVAVVVDSCASGDTPAVVVVGTLISPVESATDEADVAVVVGGDNNSVEGIIGLTTATGL